MKRAVQIATTADDLLLLAAWRYLRQADQQAKQSNMVLQTCLQWSTITHQPMTMQEPWQTGSTLEVC